MTNDPNTWNAAYHALDELTREEIVIDLPSTSAGTYGFEDPSQVRVRVMEPPIKEVISEGRPLLEAEFLTEQIRREEESADRRNTRNLIPLEALKETKELQDQLRNIDVSLEAMVAQFNPKKVNKVMSEIKFLEDAFYLEPERVQGLNARFAAAYTRLSASQGEYLGFLEKVEHYILKEMDGPKTNIEPISKSLRFQTLRKIIPKALDVTYASAGIAFALNANLNALGIAATAVTAYILPALGVKGLKVWKKLIKYQPDLRRGDEEAYLGFGNCSSEYKNQVNGYAANKSALRSSVVEEGNRLLVPIKENTQRACNPDEFYVQRIIEVSRSFIADVESITSAAKNYDSAVVERQRIIEQLDHKKEVEEHLRGLSKPYKAK